MALPFHTIVVLSLLLVGSIVPLAHGDIPNDVARVEVIGHVYCTASGNPEPPGSNSPGAVGANVSLVCDGNRTSIASATTDANGSFQITVEPPLLQIIGNITACVVQVTLPIVNCTLTPIAGRLVADIALVDEGKQPVGGIVERLAAGLLVRLLG